MNLLGYFNDNKDDLAILLYKKTHFQTSDVEKWCDENCSLEEAFANDIYSDYLMEVSEGLNKTKLSIIYPCTEWHINKYSASEMVVVEESYEDYLNVTLPYIKSIPEEKTEWIRNVLNKTAEADRIILEDEDKKLGFILHPDFKWDQIDINSLYCLAIVHRYDVESLRDLNQEHLEMLKNLDKKCREAI